MSSGRRRAVAAALFVVIASMATLTARTFLAPIEVPPPETGTLIVNTYPSGASVIIDGRRRGNSPLVVGLMPGEHSLEVVGEADRRSLPVFILAGAQVAQMIKLTPPTAESEAPAAASEPVAPSVAPVAEAPVAAATPASAPEPGWLAVAAPAEVQVYEGERLLGTNRVSRIALTAGRHELRIVNESLGFKATRTVTVTPGKVSMVKLEWPKGALSINAMPWAEVAIDGERVGETPIGDLMLPIGPHDVVFRHPELGEQRHRVTISASAPARLSVDLRKR